MIPRARHLAPLALAFAAACGGDRDGSAPSARPSSGRVAPVRPASPATSASAGTVIGDACGPAVARGCAGALTCVQPADGTQATCQALAKGVPCGAFQCPPDAACCDAARDDCVGPGELCERR